MVPSYQNPFVSRQSFIVRAQFYKDAEEPGRASSVVNLLSQSK